MANLQPDVFDIVQAYGGKKVAYVEFNAVTAADVMQFADSGVAGIKHMDLRQDTDGAFVLGVIAGASDVDITVGAGPAAVKVTGTIMWRSY